MQGEANTASKRDKRESLWMRLLVKMRSDRRFEWIVYASVAAVVIGIYFIAVDQPQSRQVDTETVVASQTDNNLEARLQEVLSCIRGAGRVSVMITYETGKEIVPARTTSVNSNGSESDDGEKRSASQQMTESTEPATISGSDGNTPIVLKEIEPVVRGVIVVADGAADVGIGTDLDALEFQMPVL